MSKCSEACFYLVLCSLLICFILSTTSYEIGKRDVIKQAIERDLMVQCPGNEGWFWECENEH